MIKGAITSGLLSSGVTVMDYQTMPIPILRQELGKGSGTGGVFVRKSPFDSSRCDIIFFDSWIRKCFMESFHLLTNFTLFKLTRDIASFISMLLVP